ncbi:MAG: DinB family protein [Solirubrobacteraceae bacterium]
MSDAGPDRNDLCAVLATVPERAADIRSELDGSGLAYRHGPSFPTVGEILSHLCQSGSAIEAVLRPVALESADELRLRAALETDREADLLPPLETQLDDFSRTRRRTVDVLHAMPTSFWDREVLDPAIGRLTVREAVGSVARHELGHLSQLQSLVALLPVA